MATSLYDYPEPPRPPRSPAPEEEEDEEEEEEEKRAPRSARRLPQEERGAVINVGGGDDALARLQLAARWAELYAPHEGDSLTAALARFRTAFDYVDAVIHGLEPPQA